jgi:hypothetical protein
LISGLLGGLESSLSEGTLRVQSNQRHPPPRLSRAGSLDRDVPAFSDEENISDDPMFNQ